jgi:mRNA-degrading endonuclease RelE of RelBE toxin-antitoxin system
MSWTLRFLKPFASEYLDLPEAIREQVDKALHLLIANPRHPSLQVKKIQPKTLGIFEARVTKAYRITFELDGSIVLLRRVGTHAILRTP